MCTSAVLERMQVPAEMFPWKCMVGVKKVEARQVEVEARKMEVETLVGYSRNRCHEYQCRSRLARG